MTSLVLVDPGYTENRKKKTRGEKLNILNKKEPLTNSSTILTLLNLV